MELYIELCRYVQQAIDMWGHDFTYRCKWNMQERFHQVIHEGVNLLPALNFLTNPNEGTAGTERQRKLWCPASFPSFMCTDQWRIFCSSWPWLHYPGWWSDIDFLAWEQIGIHMIFIFLAWEQIGGCLAFFVLY